MAKQEDTVAMQATPVVRGDGAYRGVALSQLRILKQQMELGGLNVGRRIVDVGTGVQIVCEICFNHEVAFVNSVAKNKQIAEEAQNEFSLYRFIVCVYVPGEKNDQIFLGINKSKKNGEDKYLIKIDNNAFTKIAQNDLFYQYGGFSRTTKYGSVETVFGITNGRFLGKKNLDEYPSVVSDHMFYAVIDDKDNYIRYGFNGGYFIEANRIGGAVVSIFYRNNLIFSQGFSGSILTPTAPISWSGKKICFAVIQTVEPSNIFSTFTQTSTVYECTVDIDERGVATASLTHDEEFIYTRTITYEYGTDGSHIFKETQNGVKVAYCGYYNQDEEMTIVTQKYDCVFERGVLKTPYYRNIMEQEHIKFTSKDFLNNTISSTGPVVVSSQCIVNYNRKTEYIPEPLIVENDNRINRPVLQTLPDNALITPVEIPIPHILPEELYGRFYTHFHQQIKFKSPVNETNYSSGQMSGLVYSQASYIAAITNFSSTRFDVATSITWNEVRVDSSGSLGDISQVSGYPNYVYSNTYFNPASESYIDISTRYGDIREELVWMGEKRYYAKIASIGFLPKTLSNGSPLSIGDYISSYPEIVQFPYKYGNSPWNTFLPDDPRSETELNPPYITSDGKKHYCETYHLKNAFLPILVSDEYTNEFSGQAVTFHSLHGDIFKTVLMEDDNLNKTGVSAYGTIPVNVSYSKFHYSKTHNTAVFANERQELFLVNDGKMYSFNIKEIIDKYFKKPVTCSINIIFTDMGD